MTCQNFCFLQNKYRTKLTYVTFKYYLCQYSLTKIDDLSVIIVNFSYQDDEVLILIGNQQQLYL